MFKIKLFVSLAALSCALSTTSLLAMEPLQSNEEQKVARISRALGTEEQQRFVYGNKTLVKGEVPGDGSCFLHSLDLLFPGQGINRQTFIKRLRNVVHNGTQESEEAKEALAHELHYTLAEQPHFGGYVHEKSEFSGAFIASLTTHFNFDNIEENVQQIKSNKDVIAEIINNLARDNKMLSLSANRETLGTFGLVCKLFNLNLDVFSRAEGNSLELRQAFRFGGDASTQNVLFSFKGAHVSPLCNVHDLERRNRLATKILQMIQNGEGVYKTIDSAIRKKALGESTASANLVIEKKVQVQHNAPKMVIGRNLANKTIVETKKDKMKGKK